MSGRSKRSPTPSPRKAAKNRAETRAASRRSVTSYECDPRIPEKHNFRIGEVAEIANVETHVLRFWETEFQVLQPAKNKANRRIYTRADVVTVLRIHDLLYEDGFTIAGARRQIESGAPQPRSAPARTRAVLQQIRKDVEDLLRLVEE